MVAKIIFKVGLLFCSFGLGVSTLPSRAQPVQLPAGWTVAATQNGMATLKIAGSEDVALIGLLASGDAGKILAAVATQASPAYRIDQILPVQKIAYDRLQGGAALRFADGRQMLKLVVAKTLANQTTAVAALITADFQNKPAMTAKSASLSDMMQQLESGRTVPGAAPVSIAPPSRQVITGGKPAPSGVLLDTVGGTFVPGKYIGKTFYRKHDTGKTDRESSMTLYLFDNGEYSIAGRDEEYGKPYSTDPANGELNLRFGQAISFFNGDNNGEDIALYGSYKGTPALFGRSDRGFSDYYIILIRAGPTGKLSPTQASEKKAADVAEANRYKFTVPWGKGAGVSAVAAVVYTSTFNSFYNGAMNTSMTHDVNVLFRDGTFHEEFPVPLQVWDTTTAKRRDTKSWGRWRVVAGGKYLLTYSDGETKYFTGTSTRPARAGETLSGRYGAGSSSGNLMTSSYSLRYITFTGNRFEIDDSSGTGSSTFSQTVPGNPMINTSTSNGETFTSVTGENFAVSTGRKGKGSARTGSYQLSGYTLRLQFDDGRVTYQPFFFIGDSTIIWYDGESRSKD
jgi:hypothetical protein